MSSCTPEKPSIVPKNPEDCVSLEDLVRHYLYGKYTNKKQKEKGEKTPQEWHDDYLTSLEDITDYICGEKNTEKAPDGSNYIFNSHQWNFKFPSRQPIVNSMATKLKDIYDVKFNDFEELIDYVESKKESHFGETAIYDFSLRYGWNQNPPIKPQAYVYVHSKPREAAKYLVDHGFLKRISNLERRMKLESYEELLLPGMTASDVEHFLCCYHDEILKLK